MASSYEGSPYIYVIGEKCSGRIVKYCDVEA